MNMKDQRFTELLNLHLDHELTPVEAAELEAEMQRAPARRRQFREFSRMQRACAQLFEREHARAPASFALEQALRDAERKVAAPAARPLYRHPLASAFAGFAAMAACVAFVVLRSTPPAQVQTLAPGFASHQAPPSPAASLASYPAGSALGDDYKSIYEDQVVSDSGHTVADWMQGVELPALQPVIIDALAVNSPARLSSSLVSEVTPHALRVNTEFVGFQFQR